MNLEACRYYYNLVPEGSAFSHAYAGDGHIAIREMKPSPEAKTIADEISKVFRIHSHGLFNDFINNEGLLNILEDIIGPDIDCFLESIYSSRIQELGDSLGIRIHLIFLLIENLRVAAWLATSEATLENGCLVVLPGSHKESLHEHLPDDREGSNYGYTEIKDHDFSAEVPL